MPRRLAVLLTALALLGGCAHTPIPSPPDLSSFTWAVQRDQLPPLSARVLVVAWTAGRERIVVEGGDSELVEMPVYAFVLEHPTEGLVLIDPGFGRRTATDPGDYPGKQASRLLRLRMEPGAAVADRLAEIGHSPADVRHMVVTHLHSDHVGGVEDFPDAALWVHRDEWEAAGERSPLGTKPDLRPFENLPYIKTFDFTGTDPYGPFEGHIDLFGDRSVILLPTPGHTVGHISVLLNLGEQSLLIVGDAAWIDRHWKEGLPKGQLVRSLLEEDWKKNMGNLWRIRQWAEQHPDLLILAGHEASALEWLKPWPEAYR